MGSKIRVRTWDEPPISFSRSMETLRSTAGTTTSLIIFKRHRSTTLSLGIGTDASSAHPETAHLETSTVFYRMLFCFTWSLDLVIQKQLSVHSPSRPLLSIRVMLNFRGTHLGKMQRCKRMHLRVVLGVFRDPAASVVIALKSHTSVIKITGSIASVGRCVQANPVRSKGSWIRRR
jgi:hypothetical protein